MTDSQIKVDLYPSINSSTKNSAIKKYWYFISNKVKLHHILATGLIIEHYGSIKHSNSTSDQAGWIPLFTENNISSGSANEDIIIKIDTSSFTGQIFAENSLGELESKESFNDLTSSNQEIYLRAPIPITAITEVVFPNKDSKEDFIDRASGYKNENLDIFVLKVKKPPKKILLKNYSSQLPSLEQDKNLLDRVQVAAAIRGLHFKLANKHKDASDLYNAFYCQNDDASAVRDFNKEHILKEVPYWINHGKISSEYESDTSKKHVVLFWNIVKSINNSGKDVTVHDAVINELNNAQHSIPDEALKKALATLKEDLIDIRTSTTKTLDQLFEQHKKPFSRALIIFFVRDKVAELVKFRDSQVNTIDLLVASLLFGAREQWKNFSTEVRGYSLFTKEQSIFMTNLFHAQTGTGIEVKTTAKNIKPLYDLLLGDNAIKSNAKKFRDTRVMVANSMGWDCITYKVLINGEFFTRPGKTTELSANKDIFSVDAEVQIDKFDQLLGVDTIKNSIEEKARENIK